MEAERDDGPVVAGVGELARRLGVSQPRVTQLVNLTWLAPAIQAALVELEAVDGVEPMTERVLRAVLREMGWGAQARVWALRERVGGSDGPGARRALVRRETRSATVLDSPPRG